ncbi:glycosyltransferase family 4 protein [Azospirillum halopraeferens]|uniref:glycosyltransferase family 4 protein n=1 Tax=Azospirillum halopraeferens TaxID=34010 RepID=UPI00040E11B2|nr:glycosyltransferase family 4 protein [Azospirillum halopraeferens]
MTTLILERQASRTETPPAPPSAGRRIVIHDYAGHFFPAQLSRWLAARGNHVLHLHCPDLETPRGRLERAPGDPDGFHGEAVSIARPMAKYALTRRWMQERAYGRRLADRIAAFAPDVVLSAQAPPAVLAHLAGRLNRPGVPLVAWVQDLFTPGVAVAAARWPAPLRHLARRTVQAVEFGALRRAAALVVISPDFVPVLRAHGLDHPDCSVIENWAPLGELTARPKDNPWARRHGLANRFVFQFSGTLGMKHDPEFLADLARAFRDDDGVRVVVVSQGLGRRHLEEVKAREGLDGLILLDFQSREEFPDTLAAADVAVVLLEPFAGGLSVPSKVYSYFCAERAILGAVPAANLARRLIEREGAGLCVDPGDRDGFIAAARRLRDDPDLRAACARRQAAYAATAFAMDRIGPRFADILDRVCTARVPR